MKIVDDLHRMSGVPVDETDFADVFSFVTNEDRTRWVAKHPTAKPGGSLGRVGQTVQRLAENVMAGRPLIRRDGEPVELEHPGQESAVIVGSASHQQEDTAQVELQRQAMFARIAENIILEKQRRRQTNGYATPQVSREGPVGEPGFEM